MPVDDHEETLVMTSPRFFAEESLNKTMGLPSLFSPMDNVNRDADESSLQVPEVHETTGEVPLSLSDSLVVSIVDAEGLSLSELAEVTLSDSGEITLPNGVVISLSDSDLIPLSEGHQVMLADAAVSLGTESVATALRGGAPVLPVVVVDSDDDSSLEDTREKKFEGGRCQRVYPSPKVVAIIARKSKEREALGLATSKVSASVEQTDGSCKWTKVPGMTSVFSRFGAAPSFMKLMGLVALAAITVSIVPTLSAHWPW
jgi:hypothetical protein